MSSVWKWFKRTFFAAGGITGDSAAAYEKHCDEEDLSELHAQASLPARSDAHPSSQFQEPAKTPRPAYSSDGSEAEKPPTPGHAHTPLMQSCSWQDQLRSSSAELDSNNRSKRADWDGAGDSPDSCTPSSSSSPEHCDLDVQDQQQQQQQQHKRALLKPAESSWVTGAADLVTPPHAVSNGRFVLSDDGQTAGIANTVTKYLPNRAVVPHATPFDLRVDQALALERRQLAAASHDDTTPLHWTGFTTKSDH